MKPLFGGIFDFNHDGKTDPIEIAAAYAVVNGITETAKEEQRCEQEEWEELVEALEDIKGRLAGTGVVIDIDYDGEEASDETAEQVEERLDELREQLEELEDQEPEDDESEAYERWEERRDELEEKIDELEDILDDLERL